MARLFVIHERIEELRDIDHPIPLGSKFGHMIHRGESSKKKHTIFVHRERPSDDLPISQEFWDETDGYSPGMQRFGEHAFDAVVSLERRVNDLEARLGEEVE